ncbi:methyltransferase domain-containing protein [Candidatus Kaiserbacteria bacterium]|nr:methyltransferase domain-containing protein [Candidatus Kaiserbacteria bacterium]
MRQRITKPFKRKKQNTTWGHVADWYHQHVTENEDTYHEKVIKPNLMEVLGDLKGKHVLDVACGQGIFSREMHARGAQVTGIDIAPELIEIAKKAGPADISYRVAPADRIALPDTSFDVAICVLALQNIKNLSGTIAQIASLLKKGGEFVIVLNHPGFRIPRRSQWGYDPDTKVQFRRLDGYLSESAHRIEMHPGSERHITTITYHRPLQSYVSALANHGFSVTGLEEWISHKESEKGPKSEAENRARKEFPLFLMLRAQKN